MPIMATPVSVADLKEEARCPLCKSYLTDPVLMDCGHNFCRGCISDYYVSWTEEKGPLQCPVCHKPIQEGKLRPNEQLGSMVEKLRQISPLKLEKDCLCTKHNEKLNLFCENDEELVCVICERSPEHESHTVHLAEDVVQKYKVQMYRRLATLRETKDNIKTMPADAEKETLDLIKRIETEKDKTVTDFKNLHAFLDEQQKFLVTQMQELQKQMARKRRQYLGSLSEEVSSQKGLIKEMEESCKKPAIEFLMDFKKNLQRCDTAFQDLVSFPPALKWKLSDFCDTNLLLENIAEQYKETLVSGLLLQEENITLDPDTAHPQLILSENDTSVRMGEFYKNLPKNPERFDVWPFVLGCEGFTGGRHFWEVSVGSEEAWGIGVARNSVRRKGDIDFSPEGGFWAVGRWEGIYTAYNPPFYNLLTLHGEPKRIRVLLNYDGGWVTFFDADTGDSIYSYSASSFSGETIFPFFYIFGNAQLSLTAPTVNSVAPVDVN
ncbi:tripartite motif-containing protein 10-like [Sceloporus undulatus]|uniref:tripartite motif-containing protein 10-like n=1 Tax=Sceloporus undulatus TaxID=8520 RepID=UPI001C4D13AD|nr:tripartite motif-containing protein 10-like [Sceloporus undulatus]XP_042306671.1 tripartite motif-containing protein 10-like [Sceloporus undulatus]XP_042306672.1 tripartite motif-containing protein 10-like [Sceloporus undulatus]XP_042306673.1 tripartite motif-containing protein 10-like [Sceloporus undulatus]XP_042306674.1 tripartite motif-containing protein 10-like [Sceloporus undulatus]XP_042306675.1 tripartite motif-containing protein 10-like [Sceloporus undulatus]XP_042306676.1 triparti